MTSTASRYQLIIAVVLGLVFAPAGTRLIKSAEARPAAHRHHKKKRAHRRHRRRRHKRTFHGHSVPKEHLRTAALPKSSGDLWVWSPNFREEVKVNIYKADGSYNQEALASLDHIFRCKRTGEERAVDPKLYEILAIISDHFGGKRIELTSGFRFQKNEGSRHFHASAMDIRVSGVSVRELYNYADSLDRGGMGIGRYPRSGFVHVDFRAPGEPSYRWTDTSGGGGRNRGRTPSTAWRKPKS